VHRVVITGLGCITPIGNDVDSFRTSLFAGATGIAAFHAYPEAPGPTQGLRFTRTAAVKDFDPRQHLDSGVVVSTDRTTQFAILAARQAAQHSNLLQHHSPEDVAILVGCSCGGRQAEETETAKLYTRDARVHPLTVTRTMASAGSSHISIDLGVTGPVLNISTACASGTHAIGLAFQIVDDVLDIEAPSESLGKTAGKDQVQQKITFPVVYGLERSRQMAESERLQAHAALGIFNGRADRLRQIADFVVHRKA